MVPKKTKFRKHQRGRLRGRATGGATLMFGEYGLQSLDCGYLTTNQVEAARKSLAHFFKRGGKIWLRVFADKIETARAAETRMGGGKGAPVRFVAPVKRGHIIFEVAGVTAEEAKEALRLASFKLPLATRLVAKA
ncbi:MAG: 50S ribosomal protein L16 [Candidatus Margulisbacteria bacterium]|nr:50S ribosomal protein L16 [Candidatus Margulisiibacteriota bacterium]